MVRATFQKKLRKIGEVPTPAGHAKTNKGVSTYFFDNGKRGEVEQLLAGLGLSNQGQMPMYEQGTTLWRTECSAKRVVLSAKPGWFGVSVLSWPA